MGSRPERCRAATRDHSLRNLRCGNLGVRAMPFGQLELDEYLLTRKITGLASDYIRRSAAGLSRDVRPSGHSSCVVEFQSFKTGVTVSTESRTGELPYAFELDYNESVLAYYEQPPAVEVRRHTKRGYRRLTRYTPDFLVLAEDGPKVVQVKLRIELESMVVEKQDWVRQPDGTFQDLAASEVFETIGLPHVVAAIDEADQLRAANLGLMLRALREATADDVALATRVSVHMEQRGLMPLADLAQARQALEAALAKLTPAAAAFVAEFEKTLPALKGFQAAAQTLRGRDAFGGGQRAALLGQALAKLAALGGGVHVSLGSVMGAPCSSSGNPDDEQGGNQVA